MSQIHPYHVAVTIEGRVIRVGRRAEPGSSAHRDAVAELLNVRPGETVPRAVVAMADWRDIPLPGDVLAIDAEGVANIVR